MLANNISIRFYLLAAQAKISSKNQADSKISRYYL